MCQLISHGHNISIEEYKTTFLIQLVRNKVVIIISGRYFIDSIRSMNDSIQVIILMKHELVRPRLMNT